MVDHTGSSYKGKAQKYAQKVDSSPWNAHYERPAMISLLPPLEKTHVLDVGCGSGWYAEYLLDHGAAVTSFDLDPEFVRLTRLRVKQQTKVLQADLSKPLNFAADSEFDVVLCPLVMHYLKDWKTVFHEFYRVLKPHGILIFSTHHPFNDWKLFEKDDYFAVELLEDEWEDVGKVEFYRRPLTIISQDLACTGFLVEQLLEPQPTKDFKNLNPEGFERLSKNPWFIAVRAVKNSTNKPTISPPGDKRTRPVNSKGLFGGSI